MKSMISRSLSLMFLLLIASYSCSEEEDRQEVVSKLRAIGMKAEPGISSPSDGSPKVMNFTAMALLPEGQSVDSVEEYQDQGTRFSLPSVGMTIDSQNIEYEDLSPLRLVMVRGTIPIPSEERLDFVAFNNVVRFRYGLTMRAGDEFENIVGDFLVVPADNPALSLEQPVVDIEQPLADTNFGPGVEIDVKAMVSKGDEDVKIGWFVSGGEIKNRRSQETKWKLPESPGPHRLMVGVYSKITRTFDYKSVSVNIVP